MYGPIHATVQRGVPMSTRVDARRIDRAIPAVLFAPSSVRFPADSHGARRDAARVWLGTAAAPAAVRWGAYAAGWSPGIGARLHERGRDDASGLARVLHR